MSTFNPKAESAEFTANPTQTGQPANADAIAEITEIAIRLWGFPRGVPLTWGIDSVLLYMIADLVQASGGGPSDENPDILAACFASSQAALLAARRIQTAILEFLNCRPAERFGGSILIYHPLSAGPEGLSRQAVQRALRLATPGQILLAENVFRHLREIPGIEVRPIPGLTTAVAGERELSELVWTTAERMALAQRSVGDQPEVAAPDISIAGATVIAHSPFSPRVTTRQTTVGPVAQDNSTPVIRTNASNVVLFGATEGKKRGGLNIRNLVLVGSLATVLAALVLVALYRGSSDVSKNPIRVPEEHITLPQTSVDKQTPAVEPESKNVQPIVVKTESVKQRSALPRKKAAAVAVSSQAPSAGEARPNDQEITNPALEESGGVSQKDIPTLLKMAQADAGAGNYDKARTEFRKILGLQPNNQEAKEGLHKLDIIQKDRQ